MDHWSSTTEGAHISISYTLKNGGTAPAIGTFTIGSGLIVGPMPRTPEETRRIIDCGKVTRTPRPGGMPPTIDKFSGDVGVLILPGDTQEIKSTLHTPKGQTKVTRPQEVWFPLCIRYKDDLGDYHGTGVLWKFVADGGNEIQGVESVEGSFKQIGIGNEAY